MDYSFKNKDGQDVKGWLSEEEAGILYEYALEAPIPRILELGSFVGKSSIVLASAIKKRDGVLVCIDFFWKNFRYVTPDTEEIIPDVLESFWSNIRERNLENYVMTLRGNHNTIIPTLRGEFGMIFIDGGHTIENTLSVALDSWERLGKGGYLVFHDYNNTTWPDVKICVDVLKNKWQREFIKKAKNSNMVVLQK